MPNYLGRVLGTTEYVFSWEMGWLYIYFYLLGRKYSTNIGDGITLYGFAIY